MLLECHIVDGEGEATKIEPDQVKLTSNTLAIIVSHDDHYIYVFKGKNVSIVQKFASARTASQMRLQQGYRILHVEEAEGIDKQFEPIMAHLGGLQEGEAPKVETKEEPKPEPKKTIPTPKPLKPPVQSAPPRAKITETKEPAKKVGPGPKEKPDISRFEDKVIKKVYKVLELVIELEPPADSECDYLLIGNRFYMVTGKNKKDLRYGEFDLEEMTTLPEGIFPVENYFPRLLCQKKKVVGVEFWARR